MDIREFFIETAERTSHPDEFEPNNKRFHIEGYIRLSGDEAVNFLNTARTIPGHSGIEYFEDVTETNVGTMPHGVDIGLEEWGFGRLAIIVHNPCTADWL